MTATLNGTASDDVTVTVAASPVAPTVANDFTLSGTTLTIEAGQTSSTGTVTITAKDNDLHGAPKAVTVTGTVTGSTSVTAPAAQTLTITDNETPPTVTLGLAPEEISEDEGVSTVTATLSGPSSEDVTLTVSATPVSPAVAADFELSGNAELTITAGPTSSTGTATVTANDNTVDAPNKEVTISGTVSGLTGLAAPASETLTITDDDVVPHGDPTVTVAATPVSPAAATDFELTGTTLTIGGRPI